MLPQLPAQCEILCAKSTPITIPNPPSEPRPILSLHTQDQVLYAELVATAERDLRESTVMLWVRPLILAFLASKTSSHHVLDLSHTADLLWPAQQFVPAYAEDLLPLWDLAVIRSEARQELQAFMHQIWQASQK